MKNETATYFIIKTNDYFCGSVNHKVDTASPLQHLLCGSHPTEVIIFL